MDFSAANFWIIFIIAAGVTAGFTPAAIKVAMKTGALDVPKDNRRMHDRPVPRIGGMAIFIGVTASILFAVFMGYCDGGPHAKYDVQRMMLYGTILGGTMMYVLGTIDDYVDLKAPVKLAGQIAVATVAFMFGVRLQFIYFFFGDTPLSGVVCYLITIIWLVGITNTINLVDGLDGLAAGIAAIASLSIAYVSYIFGYYPACFPMLAIAGGCLGFLPFNFYPAKTFMGDGGSLFLGFMIASFALLQPVKSTTILAVIIPSLVLSLPLFDTLFAIIRRLVNHKPVMGADKEHIHHRLMRAGLGQRRTVLCMYGICGIMGVAAILVARDLYKETFGLVIIAIMYIYVVLTDPNRRSPHLKNVESDPKNKK